MPTGVEGERAGRTSFCVSTIQIFRHSVRGEEEGVQASIILSGGVFNNHASGSGAKAHDLLISRLRPFRFSGVGGDDWWLWRLPTLDGGTSGMHASG